MHDVKSDDQTKEKKKSKENEYFVLHLQVCNIFNADILQTLIRPPYMTQKDRYQEEQNN